jgi:hypothetical protein
VTIALEHFTAILAQAILDDPRFLAGADAEARRLWCWHALEEIEHKGVAFDVFMAATAKLSGFHRWSIRVRLMALTTFYTARNIKRNMGDIFRQDGMETPRTWRRVLGYLFARPGILRRVLPAYLAYYRPGFHPWQQDDRALLARAEAALAPG